MTDLLPEEQMDVQAALADEDEFGWCVEETVCDRCGNESISVYPLGMEELECPKCGYKQPVQGMTAQ